MIALWYCNMSSSFFLNQIPTWTLKADYAEKCNCDYVYPCNFNGFCRALVLFHIRYGTYGSVNPQGINMIRAFSWPKTIHKSNGTARSIFTKNSDEEQRKTIISIFSGQAKGEGPFALFATIIRFFLEPQNVDVTVNIGGKRSSFSVPVIIDIRSESFVNPVADEEQDTRIQLPKDFIWKIAEAVKTKVMRITIPHLNFDHSGKMQVLNF